MFKHFKRIYVEITNICNLDCKFCIKTSRKKEFMDITLFDKITDEIKDIADEVCLHVKGEPLLHPKIKEFLDICEKKKIKVNLVTNGTQIPKVKDILVKSKAIRKISFSLHALDETGLDEILSFIMSLKDVLISLRLWNKGNSKNNTILQKLKEAFSLELLPDVDNFKLKENISVDVDELFEWPSLQNPLVGIKGFCLGLRNQVAILVDGTVVPCCLDAEGIINLGNINISSLKEILESDRSKEFYEHFSNRKVKEELCRHCSYKNRFDC